MKNRKDFIKEYIKNNLNSTNVEEAMNATFDFCNDFIETKDELPSEENGFFNKPVIMVLENIKNPNKYTAKIGKYYKDHYTIQIKRYLYGVVMFLNMVLIQRMMNIKLLLGDQ